MQSRVLAAVLSLACVAMARRARPFPSLSNMSKAWSSAWSSTQSSTKGDPLYKCDSIATYDAKSAKKSCANAKVAFACFSLDDNVDWQCFDDEDHARTVDCVDVDTPDAAGKYDGACVYKSDDRYSTAQDGSALVTWSTRRGGPGSRSFTNSSGMTWYSSRRGATAAKTTTTTNRNGASGRSTQALLVGVMWSTAAVLLA